MTPLLKTGIAITGLGGVAETLRGKGRLNNDLRLKSPGLIPLSDDFHATLLILPAESSLDTIRLEGYIAIVPYPR